MFDHSNVRINHTHTSFSDLSLPPVEVKRLQDLAKEMVEVAHTPGQDELRGLWQSHNKLENTRPLILADPENGWNEILTEDMMLNTHPVARLWEGILRKYIFWGREMGDDMTLPRQFDVPMIYRENSWRVDGIHGDHSGRPDTYREDGGAYELETVLENLGQIDRVRTPEIHLDRGLSGRVVDAAREIFEGIIPVNPRTVWFWSVGLTDEYVSLRGLENLFYDFLDHPEEVHRLMSLLQKGTMNRLDFLEEQGVLSANDDETYVGSGGLGWSDELLSAADCVTTRNMWGLSESQVTVGVSPEMFGEFIFPYQKPIMERFGLSCYGCCEPLESRWDYLKSVENLRRISVSPWANPSAMAEHLQDQYIYSLKPSPTPLASPVMDEDLVRRELKAKVAAAKGCRLEIIMKDNHTLGGNPENITNWVRIAREVIGA